MLSKKEVIKKLKDSFPDLRREYGLKRIGLFGSYASGACKPGSDIDIIAEFEKPIGFKFVEFVEYLDKTLGQKTDVLTPDGVKGIRNAEISNAIQTSIEYVQ